MTVPWQQCMLSDWSALTTFLCNSDQVVCAAGRTLAVKESTEPQWRETLFLYVRDPDNQTMSIHVEHATKEVEDVNVLLGMATVKDFKSLLSGDVIDLEFDLQG